MVVLVIFGVRKSSLLNCVTHPIERVALRMHKQYGDGTRTLGSVMYYQICYL